MWLYLKEQNKTNLEDRLLIVSLLRGVPVVIQLTGSMEGGIFISKPICSYQIITKRSEEI